MKIFTFMLLSSVLSLACPTPNQRTIELQDVHRTITISPSYTQGLLFYKGKLFESSGIYGRSRFSRIDPVTGSKRVLYYLPRHIFAEGLAVMKNKFYQFSWNEKEVFIYDALDALKRNSVRPNKDRYNGEAWGLTTHNDKLLLSDGTTKLHYLSAKGLTITDSFEVKDGDKALDDLNELESIKGNIWANVWGSYFIFIINPVDGCVIEKLDLTRLYEVATQYASEDDPNYDPWEHVLNGIAYDPLSGEVYITGKNWRYMFVLNQ